MVLDAIGEPALADALWRIAVGAAGASSTPRPDDARSRLTPLRELQLVQAHQSGDPDAVRELVEAYQHRVFSVCYRMLNDREAAADLTQDTLVKVIEGLDGYQTRAKLSTWIIRIAMNCCLSHMRRQKVRRHLPLDATRPGERSTLAANLPDSSEHSSSRHVEQAELHNQLLAAMASLDPDMRAILMLRDLQGLEYGQIAEVLDVPVGTIKSRLFRARAALRGALEQIQGPLSSRGTPPRAPEGM